MISTVKVGKATDIIDFSMTKERMLYEYVSGANVGNLGLIEGDIIWHDKTDAGSRIYALGRACNGELTTDIEVAPVNIDMLRVIKVRALNNGDSVTLCFG